MATIDLTDAETLAFSQAANYVNGGIYQFGRTVSLSITAFIKPPNGIDSARFQNITDKEKQRLLEIKESGFVDNISINGHIVNNVKILSFAFPTSEATITDHIQLLRVNMDLEFYETFDNIQTLTSADSDIYKNITFLEEQYAKYFSSFGETFDVSTTDSNTFTFSHSINFSLRKDSPTSIDFKDKVKEIAIKAFDFTAASHAKIGFLDGRYSDFVRKVNGHGTFNESHNALTNTYTLSRTVNLQSGSYRADQVDESWSSGFNHAITVDDSGSITITENGVVEGRTSQAIEVGEGATDNRKEDVYENALQGYLVVKDGAYNRCQKFLNDLIKDKPNWVPGSSEWNSCPNLKDKHVSIGRQINRQSGSISYNIVFTNNPRMHNNAIFEYSIEGSTDSENIVTVGESGTITPYDTDINSEFNPKTIYDEIVSQEDVIDRLSDLFDSLKLDSSITKLDKDVNLVSSSISFPAYGTQLSYSLSYSDDPSLKNETYIRKLSKSENYTMPVALSSSVIAPNIKETHYDANQTSEGSKNVSFECIFKRNPSSNIINQDHTDYIKTATDSIVSSVKQETQTMAFVSNPQIAKNDLSWYMTNMSYNVSQDYTLNFDSEMQFIDKKGVMPEALKY